MKVNPPKGNNPGKTMQQKKSICTKSLLKKPICLFGGRVVQESFIKWH